MEPRLTFSKRRKPGYHYAGTVTMHVVRPDQSTCTREFGLWTLYAFAGQGVVDHWNRQGELGGGGFVYTYTLRRES